MKWACLLLLHTVASAYDLYVPAGVSSAKGIFCPWWPWPLTLTFELGRDYCTMHVNAKFHHPTLNRLEVIVQTNKQTDKETNRRHWKHPPGFAMLRRWVIKRSCETITGQVIW